MSFIQRELDKIRNALHEQQDKNGVLYRQLYAAQQALSWALEPTCYRSPYNMITNVDLEPMDCSDMPRPIDSLLSLPEAK